ncbi:hypothetical protein CA54_52960 [Symmachiella macrocystis]|uniref:PEP-CTERM protein-sorting domain-containing protein n=1 Tax=Symmachiella macrocystis TaxID=2527985 RepID=A0A5C6B410_9PLAN|nr:PEP-CTERM sorting domain-containing protein [Symmachiella macrocystis]TWU06893.1 hypothetical protein CA54_52960 [Symmachiella macrocystis]
MKRMIQLTVACVAVLAVVPTATFGEVIEVGDLNIIDDLGNPSDGLRYLDMTFSAGLSQAAALANAQSTYSNARLATPDEFDNLFEASGIQLNGPIPASAGFTTGTSVSLSTGANYDGGALAAALGLTVGNNLIVYTDPDGSDDTSSTRDLLQFGPTFVFVAQFSGVPSSNGGWLLVSDAAVVPEPSTYAGLLGITCVSLLAYDWRRKRQQAA